MYYCRSAPWLSTYPIVLPCTLVPQLSNPALPCTSLQGTRTVSRPEDKITHSASRHAGRSAQGDKTRPRPRLCRLFPRLVPWYIVGCVWEKKRSKNHTTLPDRQVHDRSVETHRHAVVPADSVTALQLPRPAVDDLYSPWCQGCGGCMRLNLSEPPSDGTDVSNASSPVGCGTAMVGIPTAVLSREDKRRRTARGRHGSIHRPHRFCTPSAAVCCDDSCTELQAVLQSIHTSTMYYNSPHANPISPVHVTHYPPVRPRRAAQRTGEKFGLHAIN